MKKYFFAAVIIAAIAFSSCEKLLLNPQEESKAPLSVNHQSKLAVVLDSLRYTMDLPALAGAIVTDTEIVDAQAVGCRRYGGPVTVTNNDQFHLGSCGKVFTAVLMGTLVDEGKVKWTTTLPEIFPEYASRMRAEYRDVTVRDILSHSAGFMRDQADITYKTSDPKSQRLEVVQWALAQAPVQKKGSYLYSNMGFIIAGAIAEKLANGVYEDLVMQRIIKPLGIISAGIGGPMGTPGKEDEPLQHTCNHGPIYPTPGAALHNVYNPAGGLYMSVIDWAKFAKWLLAAEAGHQSLLSPQTAAAVTSPVVSDGTGGYYGLGIGVYIGSSPIDKFLSHSGSNGFNYSTLILFSARKYGVIVMTNQGAAGDEWLLGPAVNRLIDFYNKKR